MLYNLRCYPTRASGGRGVDRSRDVCTGSSVSGKAHFSELPFWSEAELPSLPPHTPLHASIQLPLILFTQLVYITEVHVDASVSYEITCMHYFSLVMFPGIRSLLVLVLLSLPLSASVLCLLSPSGSPALYLYKSPCRAFVSIIRIAVYRAQQALSLPLSLLSPPCTWSHMCGFWISLIAADHTQHLLSLCSRSSPWYSRVGAAISAYLG